MVHPASISPVLHNLRFFERLQMERKQRLFGFQKVRQITHALFPLTEPVTNLDAGRIAKRAEPGGGLLRCNRTRRKNGFCGGRCHTKNISIKIDMSRRLRLFTIFTV